MRGFVHTGEAGTRPAVLCLGCLTGFDEPKKVDGYLWCGCGMPELVHLRPVEGAYRFGPLA